MDINAILSCDTDRPCSLGAFAMRWPTVSLLIAALAACGGDDGSKPAASAANEPATVNIIVKPGAIPINLRSVNPREDALLAAEAELEDDEETPLPVPVSVTDPAATVAEGSPVLVLYDAPPGVPYSKFGAIYGIMLANLLGHFNLQVDLLPIQQYNAGRMENYAATFYFGSYYYGGSEIPAAFLADADTTTKTLVWFGYNIWHYAWNSNYAFTSKYGLNFLGLHGLDGTPTAANPYPGFFDEVLYKGKSLFKYYSFDPSTQAVAADPDLGMMSIVDPGKASAVVNIRNSTSGEVIPYIVRSGNLWYVADRALSYIGPRDRYLVLADVLHDMLGSAHQEQHRAMVRLEDIHPASDANNLQQVTGFLAEKDVPFSIALIPFYRDPLGHYTNNGRPEEIHLAQATGLLTALNSALLQGGQIIMHGYTHQYGDAINAESGVSGEDFEFWDVVNDQPLPEDSLAWVDGRITAAFAEFSSSGISPYVWETPHYLGSPYTYRASAGRFSARYERSMYYTADEPRLHLNAGDPALDFAAGQFFPYVISRDYYGQRVLPENLGNIQYTAPLYTGEDIARNADYARLVRDGFASFFFHTYMLDPDVGVEPYADFRNVVDDISELGYTWVGGNTLVNP
jgi:uncharacterized protein YdaL